VLCQNRQHRGGVARARCHVQSEHKADRITGWLKMKRLLGDAGKPDRPGGYPIDLCRLRPLKSNLNA
jgi:hypothetical protein